LKINTFSFLNHRTLSASEQKLSGFDTVGYGLWFLVYSFWFLVWGLGLEVEGGIGYSNAGQKIKDPTSAI
jgi:hypothetical protein